MSCRGLARAAFAIVFLVVFCAAARSETGVRFCNQGNTKLYVATVRVEATFWGSEGAYWGSGWKTIDTGQCSGVTPSGRFFHLYYLLAYVDNSGNFGPYYADTKTREPFCVNAAEFSWKVDTREDARNCRAPGNFLATFTIHYSNDYNAPSVLFEDKLSPDRNRAVTPFGGGSRQTTSAVPSSQGSGTGITAGDVFHVLADIGRQLQKEDAPQPRRLTPEEKAQAPMAQWVKEDVAEFLTAAQNGFESYKDGPPSKTEGWRTWNSSRKPAMVKWCKVMQGLDRNLFYCDVTEGSDWSAVKEQYDDLVTYVSSSLPAGWTRLDGQPQSSDAAHTTFQSRGTPGGEIWIDRSANNYTLYYLVYGAQR